MKNIFLNTLAGAALVLTAASCNDFGDVNTNPESLNAGNVNYEMEFSNAEHQLLGSDWDGWRNQCIYAEQWMQHMNAIGWWWSYSALDEFSDGYSSAYWDSMWSGDRGAVQNVTEVLDLWKDDATNAVNYQLARIVRVLVMSRLTDSYGDIPYFQAGRPVLARYPEYDKQKDVYDDMLKELQEAHDALPTSGVAPMGSHDLYYQGDCAKWRSFASSLMLRLAMRLTNVDETTAKKYVGVAVANNDLIKEYKNNCILQHSDGNVNDDSAEPVAKILAHSDAGVGYLSQTIVKTLQNNGTPDPRLGMMGSRLSKGDNPSNGINSGSYVYGSSKAEDQAGVPVSASWSRTSDWFVGKFYDEIAAKTGGPDETTCTEAQKNYLKNGEYRTDYSLVGRYSYGDPQAPTFVLTAAQTNLALAEAAVRGWVSGSPADYYAEGIRQGVYQFQQFPQYGKFYSTALADCPLEAYVADKVAKFEAKDNEGKFSMIGTQYWITCYADCYETFANWRRTGYPELVSMYNPAYLEDMTGEYATEGALPRRFTYNEDERNVNPEHFATALKSLEGSMMDCYPNGRTYGTQANSWYTRVWWDCRSLKTNEVKPTTPWGRTFPASIANGFE